MEMTKNSTVISDFVHVFILLAKAKKNDKRIGSQHQQIVDHQNHLNIERKVNEILKIYGDDFKDSISNLCKKFVYLMDDLKREEYDYDDILNPLDQSLKVNVLQVYKFAESIINSFIKTRKREVND